MFFPKYAPNGLHSVGGKLAYVVLNCQCLRVSLRPSTPRPTRISLPQAFLIKILNRPILSKLLNPVKSSAFWWSMTTLKLSPITCLHYFVWIVSVIGLHAKCLHFGWPRHGGKNYCCNISCTTCTTTTFKKRGI